MDYVKNFFLSIDSSVPEKSMDKLLSLPKFEVHKKNVSLVKIGQIPKCFYILKTGVVRSFLIDSNNKEFNRTIITADSTISSVSDLFAKTPSKLGYQCLSKCEVFKFNFQEFKDIVTVDIHLLKLYMTILENLFHLFESKIRSLSILNATERYLELQEKSPGIENLIPQYHIASFLNISAVQLSRIKKDIYKK